MADIKTHLRELSVATTLGLLKSEIAFTIEELYDPKKLMYFATQVINSNLDSASNIKNMDSFNRDLRQIINNGINLAKSIYQNKHFKIESSDVLTWEGGDTNKDDPIDIKIGNYGSQNQATRRFTCRKRKSQYGKTNYFGRNEYHGRIWFKSL